MLNGFGLKALTKRIDVPNTELGIQDGQDMRSQQMKVEYQKNKSFLVLTQPVSYEYWQLDGHSDPIQEDNLPKDGYFGDPQGGF